MNYIVVGNIKEITLRRRQNRMCSSRCIAGIRRVFTVQRCVRNTISSVTARSNEQTLEFLPVSSLEKEKVLSLDKDAYEGLDFLPDYFDFFMEEPTVACSAIMDANEMVGFVATNEIDGGRTLHVQALRIKHSKQGYGYFRPFARKMVSSLLQHGYERMTNVYGPEHDKGNDAVFKQKGIVNMMHFITPFIKKATSDNNYEEYLSRCPTHTIKPVTASHIVDKYFSCDKTKAYLFPSGRMIAELIPLALIPENLHFIKGRNSFHFSSITEHEDRLTGMLSSAHILHHLSGTSSYNITIAGQDTSDLLKHLEFHYYRAMDTLNVPFCFQLFVENPCVKENLPLLLYKVGMAKNGYVKCGTLVHYEICLDHCRNIIGN